MNKSEQIPKIIHYCWFGGKPLPPLAEKCIASWKKYLPDYEIRRWDESNFDVNEIPYTQQAYEKGKFAFVSDYARFKILYDQGGLYFDTDVEVIRPMYHIIGMGSFMGCENPADTKLSPKMLGVAPGLGLGVTPHHEFYRELLTLYRNLNFIDKDGLLNTKTIVEYTSELLCQKGLMNTPLIQNVGGLNIYPSDYFCPMNYETGKITLTDNTVSIHHYAKSWHGNKEKLFYAVSRICGKKFAEFCSSVWKKLKR